MTKRRGAVIAAWMLAGLAAAQLARAEGEEQDPKLNGSLYRLWSRVMSVERELDSRGVSRSVLWCRYLGSFAHREAAGRVELRIVSQAYALSEPLAAKWQLTRNDPELRRRRAEPVNRSCPEPPDLQAVSWKPSFPSAAELAKIDAGIRPVYRKEGAEVALPLDLTARNLNEKAGLCDEKEFRLQAYFSDRPERARRFCQQLIRREFDRGMKRCLGVANRALIRVFRQKIDARVAGSAISWPGDGPTQSYCASLLPLGGTAFDELLARSYECDTPFQALRHLDFKHERARIATVIDGVFSSVTARVLPRFESMNRACDQERNSSISSR